MQVTQLSMYSRNVPKLDASVMVSRVLGSAAMRVVSHVAEAGPEALRQRLDGRRR